MRTIKTLAIGGAVAVLLAVAGVSATLAKLDTSAGEVATRVAQETGTGGGAANPQVPPGFYGSR